MSTLYEVTNEYMDILTDCQNQDELSEELISKLENIDSTFNEKANNVALVIGEIKADCETIQNEITRLKHRLEVKLKNIDKLENYLKNKMEFIGKNKIETPIHTIFIRKSTQTKISDKFIDWAMENQKERFITKKTIYTADKKLIKEEIEKGSLECPYVRLIENQNLIIK